jgi:Uma2 family endonuclease
MSAVLTPTLPAANAVPASLAASPTPGPTLAESQPFRFTVSQYRALGRLPEFQGLRTMLLNGEIYAMVLPNPPHDVALGLIDDWLRTVFTTGHHVRNQMGFDIGTANDPGPDLAVVAGSRRDHLARTPTEAVLIVEVAESSLFTDTTVKAELYATAGVQDYWVLDLEGRRLLVYRDPEPLPKGLGATAYRTHRALGPDDTIAPLATPENTVRVADLLP